MIYEGVVLRRVEHLEQRARGIARPSAGLQLVDLVDQHDGVHRLRLGGEAEARVGDGTYVRALSELQTPFVRRVNRARLEDAIELRGVLHQHGRGFRRCRIGNG